jgi:hypothetical protein
MDTEIISTLLHTINDERLSPYTPIRVINHHTRLYTRSEPQTLFCRTFSDQKNRYSAYLHEREPENLIQAFHSPKERMGARLAPAGWACGSDMYITRLQQVQSSCERGPGHHLATHDTTSEGKK